MAPCVLGMLRECWWQAEEEEAKAQARITKLTQEGVVLKTGALAARADASAAGEEAEKATYSIKQLELAAMGEATPLRRLREEMASAAKAMEGYEIEHLSAPPWILVRRVQAVDGASPLPRGQASPEGPGGTPVFPGQKQAARAVA